MKDHLNLCCSENISLKAKYLIGLYFYNLTTAIDAFKSIFASSLCRVKPSSFRKPECQLLLGLFVLIETPQSNH